MLSLHRNSTSQNRQRINNSRQSRWFSTLSKPWHSQLQGHLTKPIVLLTKSFTFNPFFPNHFVSFCWFLWGFCFSLGFYWLAGSFLFVSSCFLPLIFIKHWFLYSSCLPGVDMQLATKRTHCTWEVCSTLGTGDTFCKTLREKCILFWCCLWCF